MNTLRNTVSLIGRLGKDPIITKFGENNQVARFTLATNESFKDKKGEWISVPTWHNIVVWGAKAERCKKLKKGMSLALNGKLVYNDFETKEKEKRTSTEISVRDFISFDSKNEEA
ncbi:MAG: single-stranded DNA-binding protein [Brumimicrobium sp.]